MQVAIIHKWFANSPKFDVVIEGPIIALVEKDELRDIYYVCSSRILKGTVSQYLGYIQRKDGDEFQIISNPDEWPDEACAAIARRALLRGDV